MTKNYVFKNSYTEYLNLYISFLLVEHENELVAFYKPVLWIYLKMALNMFRLKRKFWSEGIHFLHFNNVLNSSSLYFKVYIEIICIAFK